MIKGFKQIFAQQKRPIRSYRSDRGTEYTSKQMAHFFKKNGVHHYLSFNVQKANIAERVIKTVKSKIMRYFTQHQTHRYIDILPAIVEAYNNRKHSSIGMAPSAVNSQNAKTVWERLYAPPKMYAHLLGRENHPAPAPFRYQVGDYVRISYIKHKFSRYYDQSWSGELFQITQRKRRQSLAVYTLRDYSGEPISGTFYEPELQGVKVDPDAIYKIERVLKKRTIRGKTSYLVRWQHWPSKYDSFVTPQQLQKFK